MSLTLMWLGGMFMGGIPVILVHALLMNLTGRPQHANPLPMLGLLFVLGVVLSVAGIMYT